LPVFFYSAHAYVYWRGILYKLFVIASAASGTIPNIIPGNMSRNMAALFGRRAIIGWGQLSFGVFIVMPFPARTCIFSFGLILNIPLSDDALITSDELLKIIVS